ncbi:efflux RND transporter periplasmic adaptor subunit [Andreprevotia chitinilytica]|uniref:efflux RND transporter periplasmic adaptor subunit n=1 Tax=Andreprevotia chitinilytica TaxID=396808 RepID=UPI00068CA2B4|nr:efflux RND transporter periplasmic adaptor subunit [Andreprevotia chitinilytica]
MSDRSVLRRTVLVLASAGLLAGLLTACKEEAKAVDEVRPVRTVVVGAGSANAESQLTGVIHARVESPLSFRIGGKLLERKVDVGARVAAGQALARLDPADAALQANAASAQLSAAKTQLAQAELDYKRATELLAKHFVSQAEVDRNQTTLNAARDSLRQAEAQAKLAGNQAAYATLQADAPGVITATNAEPGQVLSSGQSVLTLARDGAREVLVSVPEGQRAALAIGKSVKVKLWAQDSKTYSGTVRELSPAADAMSRTFDARITLADADAAVQLGMSASVLVDTPRSDKTGTALLPLTALFDVNGQKKLWKVDTKTAQVSSTPIKVDAILENGVMVEGVAPGTVIVTAGVHLLREGQAVKVIDTPAASPAVTDVAKTTTPAKAGA